MVNMLCQWCFRKKQSRSVFTVLTCSFNLNLNDIINLEINYCFYVPSIVFLSNAGLKLTVLKASSSDTLSVRILMEHLVPAYAVCAKENCTAGFTYQWTYGPKGLTHSDPHENVWQLLSAVLTGWQLGSKLTLSMPQFHFCFKKGQMQNFNLVFRSTFSKFKEMCRQRYTFLPSG